MNREIYTERRSFEKYDEKHHIVYLNEEVIPDYVPEVKEGEISPDPVEAYAYTGPMTDGGTLIDAQQSDRDSLINGIIRSRYTQSEEDAIKTHQIELLKDSTIEKASAYEAEWAEFNTFREQAKAVVDSWLECR